MNENELSKSIFDCCFKIHLSVGAGLFESAYEEILAYELSRQNLNFERQKAVSLKYGDITFGFGFRIAFFVKNKVILELKSLESILPVHRKQLLSYIKITNYNFGLFINFNSTLMKDEIIRIVNNL